MSDTERGRIINTIFGQGDKPFTATSIAQAARVGPNRVYDVVASMDCVTGAGSTQGELGMVNLYEATGVPPEACSACYFNSGRSPSCSRAPNHKVAINTGQPSPWEVYLKMCEEARNGHLTDASGNLIAPVDGNENA